jgi:ABC-type multidrug transport system permease subunit
MLFRLCLPLHVQPPLISPKYSVAGIPSFLEERALFVRERQNGLVGPGAFVISNTLVTLPFMFICALAFSLIW